MTNISGTTKVVGVWGHPVGHSLSPAMHNAALQELGLNWVYVPFDVDPDEINVEFAVSGLRATSMVGVNVTVPLKELVLPYTVVSEEALQIGSINTIHNKDGKLYGYSTDGAGFLQSLESAGQNTQGREVYLLGAGGSARAVAWALASRGSRCRIANRTQARSEALAAKINSVYPGRAAAVGWGMETEPFDLLVNTTTLGMQPRTEEMPPLPPEAFSMKPFVCDLIYAPARTRLMEHAEVAGCQTMSGVKMLVYQGAISLSIWTGRPLSEMPVAVMEQAVRASLPG